MESNFHFALSRQKDLILWRAIINSGSSHLVNNAFGPGSLLSKAFKSCLRGTAIHKMYV